MAMFFTSDLHFWHSGALRQRPWALNVEKMNDVMIRAWNQDVSTKDIVYVLGDLSFAGLDKTVACVGQLNGSIKLVPGNHDDRKLMAKLDAMNLIELLPPLTRIKGTKDDLRWRIELCHFPLLVWNQMHHGALHLHGHSHGNLPDDGVARRLDVGIDANFKRGWGLAPLTLETVQSILDARPGRYLDHHIPQEAA
jgi:calcineurin-like phosphoesterase family protein